MARALAAPSVLVVGGGVAGLATAWHLARRAVPVVVLERESDVFRHSSGVNAGILRAVVEDAQMAEIAAAGARALVEPDPELDSHSFVDPVGVVLTADQPAAAELLTAMVAHSHVQVHAIDPTSVNARFPHVATSALVAYESPNEGTIDLARLARRLVEGIERAGGRVHRGAAVTALVVDSGRVAGVRLANGEELRAERCVLAAGGWAQTLGAAAGSKVVLTPTRRHAALAHVPAPVDPRWPVVWNTGSSFYSRPYAGGLLVCDCDQSVVEPNALAVDDAALRHLEASARRHLTPPFTDARLDGWCGLRTFASDHRFVVGADRDVPDLVWAAALGGHGITCGLEVGRLAARAVLGESEPHLLELAPERFTSSATP